MDTEPREGHQRWPSANLSTRLVHLFIMKRSTLLKTGAVLAFASSCACGQCSGGTCSQQNKDPLGASPQLKGASLGTGRLEQFQQQQRQSQLEKVQQTAAANNAAGTRVVNGQRFITGCPDEVPYDPYEKFRAPNGKIYYLPKPPPLCHPIPMLITERDPGGNSAGASRQTAQATAEGAYMLTHNPADTDLGEQWRMMRQITDAAAHAGRGNAEADRKLEDLLKKAGVPQSTAVQPQAQLPPASQPSAAEAERQRQQEDLLREQTEQLRIQANQIRQQREAAKSQEATMAHLQAKLKALEDFAQTVRVQTAAPPLVPDGPKPVIKIVETPVNDKIIQGSPAGR